MVGVSAEEVTRNAARNEITILEAIASFPNQVATIKAIKEKTALSELAIRQSLTDLTGLCVKRAPANKRHWQLIEVGAEEPEDVDHTEDWLEPSLLKRNAFNALFGSYICQTLGAEKIYSVTHKNQATSWLRFPFDGTVRKGETIRFLKKRREVAVTVVDAEWQESRQTWLISYQYEGYLRPLRVQVAPETILSYAVPLSPSIQCGAPLLPSAQLISEYSGLIKGNRLKALEQLRQILPLIPAQYFILLEAYWNPALANTAKEIRAIRDSGDLSGLTLAKRRQLLQSKLGWMMPCLTVLFHPNLQDLP